MIGPSRSFMQGVPKVASATTRAFAHVFPTSIFRNDLEVQMPVPSGDLIVFDAECIFCSGFARFMDRHDTEMRFRFVRAQSATGRELYIAHGLDPDDWSTYIVIVDGRSYTKLAAFSAAMRAIGGPWRALGVLDLVPRGLGDWLYDRVARNRYLFGRRACPLPSTALSGRIID
jgi:predicted DCC family thiol-disulfide oxidoreductase YuxK